MVYQNLKNIIRNYDDSIVRALYLENLKIGRSNAPAKAYKSLKLKELYKISNSDEYWYEKYSEINDVLKNEMIERFLNII